MLLSFQHMSLLYLSISSLHLSTAFMNNNILRSYNCHHNFGSQLKWKVARNERLYILKTKAQTQHEVLYLSSQSNNNDRDDKNSTEQLVSSEVTTTATGSSVKVRVGNNSSLSNNNKTTTAATVVEGMGGIAGYSYDVNRVKRNLVQEAQREYKQELLDLLNSVCDVYDDTIRSYGSLDQQQHNGNEESDPEISTTIEDLIEEKLAVLFMVSPVSTTTDSNLLDGSWHFVYEADNANRVLNVEPITPQQQSLYNQNSNRNIKFPNNKNNAPWKLSKGKTDGPFQSFVRRIHLEDLQLEEYPYIIDTNIYFNGLIKLKTYFDVIKLTRTCLYLQTVSKTLSFWKHDRIHRNIQTTDDHNRITMHQILYVDSDLCITTNQKGFNGPLFVYTKSNTWTGTKQVQARKRRFLRSIPSWLLYISRIPVQQLRKRIQPNYKTTLTQQPFYTNQSNDQSPQQELTIQSLLNNNNNRTTVFKIGEIDPLNKEESLNAWNIDEDPFYHLDKENKRLDALKDLSLYDINAAGLDYKQINQELKKKWYTLPKKFKKPSNK